MTKKDLQEHWNTFYAQRQVEELGWYEETPEETLYLVGKSGLEKDASILVAGAGASTLIDHLLKLSYSGIIASDLSGESLAKLKARLGEDAGKVQWIVDDLANPVTLDKLDPVSLWIDRAVLHFLVEERDQDSYFSLLKSKILPGGYILFGEFSLEGVTSCAGLPVFRYSMEMLAEKLGPGFEIVEHFNHLYHSPSGSPRPYIYALFRRKE